tara:strand:- start:325 stop:474 length:150 start_codon:yes stop_codon:yes gene_type:complete
MPPGVPPDFIWLVKANQIGYWQNYKANPGKIMASCRDCCFCAMWFWFFR